MKSKSKKICVDVPSLNLTPDEVFSIILAYSECCKVMDDVFSADPCSLIDAVNASYKVLDFLTDKFVVYEKFSKSKSHGQKK